MHTKRKFHFPLSTLLHAATGLANALSDTDYAADMAARLDDPAATPPLVFATDLVATIAAVQTEIQKQSGKTGDTGDLTEDQAAAFAEIERLTAAARRTARLAFPGDDVKLHAEFQVGHHDKHDLAAVLDRAGKILAAVRRYPDPLKTKGWLTADTTALDDALTALNIAANDQDEAFADRVQFTADLARAANTLYALCLTCQNAARLQYPSTKPGTEAARARFLLETFPPRDREKPDGGTQGGDPPPAP